MITGDININNQQKDAYWWYFDHSREGNLVILVFVNSTIMNLYNPNTRKSPTSELLAHCLYLRRNAQFIPITLSVLKPIGPMMFKHWVIQQAKKKYKRYYEYHGYHASPRILPLKV